MFPYQHVAQKTESKVFEIKEPGYKESGIVNEITINYLEDKIISQNQRVEIEYSELDISDKKEAEDLFTKLNEPYIELKGITITTQFKKYKMIIETNVIVEELDLEELEENEGFIGNNPALFNRYLSKNPFSLKAAEYKLIELGFTEK